MPDRLKLTRDQIARICGNDPKAIKQFERLFSVADAIVPIVDSDNSADPGTAEAKAQDAQAQVQALAQITGVDNSTAYRIAVSALTEVETLKRQVAELLLRPQYVLPSSPAFDYIDLRPTAPVVAKPARFCWNDTDDTMDIFHNDGVTQQVGLETYVRFTNNTGSTITNGTAVGLEFSGGVTLANVVPYLADGNTPQLNILGITTEDVPDGEQGRITVFGRVHELDTSAFTAGDVLYPSPSVAGELTNVKPTAPQTCIPIAIVLLSHATLGIIAVRPTIEQQEWYGSFSDGTDQIHASIYTPQAITWGTTDFAQGISVVSGTQVTAANSGLYDFQLSLQVTNTNAAQKIIYVFVRKNGVDQPNTTCEITIAGNNTTIVPAWNYFLSMAAGDYFELMWAVDDTNVFLDATAAQVGPTGGVTFARPATPSAILTVSTVAQ